MSAAYVGNHYPYEADGPAHRNDSANQQGCGKKQPSLSTSDVHPPARRHLFPRGEQIQLSPADEDQGDSNQDKGSHLVDRSESRNLKPPHEPPDDPEGVGKVGDILDKQVEAGEKEVYRHSRQEQGCRGEHGPGTDQRPGYPVNKKDG